MKKKVKKSGVGERKKSSGGRRKEFRRGKQVLRVERLGKMGEEMGMQGKIKGGRGGERKVQERKS